MRITAHVQEYFERHVKRILSKSGLYKTEIIDVPETVNGVNHLLNNNFRGECILTVGVAMREILNHSCGIISIGPFGCMYSRMAEAMLKREMTVNGKMRMPGWKEKSQKFSEIGTLPFLHIETDGTPYPQIVEANLEAFILQARRVYEMQHKSGGSTADTTKHELSVNQSAV